MVNDRRGDTETRRHGDGETRRWGAAINDFFASPRPRVPASKKLGQTTMEYLLMLSFLTGIGLLIMRSMIGTEQPSPGGAVKSMTQNSVQKIADDER
jgi:hypothetical protein